MSTMPVKSKVATARPVRGCSYTTFSSGDSSFIREAVMPLAKELDGHFQSEGIPLHRKVLPGPLKMARHPTNEPFVVVGIVGLLLFVGSRFTGKILDDIYAVKIQPLVYKALGRTDKKLTGANHRKKKALQFGVWHTKHRVLILFAIVGDSFDEILKQQNHLRPLHANGIAWIVENGVQKPIHVYRIEKGQGNVSPILFDSLMEAQKYLRTGSHPGR
jgi:hypothetical protein